MEKCSNLIEAMGRLQNMEKLSGTATIYNGKKGSSISIDNWYSNNREDLTDSAKEALINAAAVLANVEQVVDECDLIVSVHTLSTARVYITVSGSAKVDLSDLMEIADGHNVILEKDSYGEIIASILYGTGENWSITVEVYNIQH